MSWHILAEMEAVCDQGGIINHGRLLVQVSVENLRRPTGTSIKLEIVLAQPDEGVVTALQEMSRIQDVKAEGRRLMVYTTIYDATSQAQIASDKRFCHRLHNFCPGSP